MPPSFTEPGSTGVTYDLSNWSGHIFEGVNFTTDVTFVDKRPKSAINPGVTLKHCTTTKEIKFVDCSQTRVYDCRFLGPEAHLLIENEKTWTENYRIKGCDFVETDNTITLTVKKAKNPSVSFKGTVIDDIFMSNCINGITVEGALYHSRITMIRGNFSPKSKYAFRIKDGSSGIGTVLDSVGFEGGEDLKSSNNSGPQLLVIGNYKPRKASLDIRTCHYKHGVERYRSLCRGIVLVGDDQDSSFEIDEISIKDGKPTNG